MGVDTSQLRKLTADLSKAGTETVRKAKLAVGKTLADIEADAKQIIIAKDIIDTGDMLGSVSYRWEGLTGEVGPDVDYAIFHELGTSTMPARPFMGPAADRRLPPFEQAMSQLGVEVLGG